MTPGMQFRLWLRTASRSQVAITLGAFAAVLALLIASITRSGDTTVSANGVTGTGSNGGATTGGGIGGGAGGSGLGGTGSTPGGGAGGSGLGGTGSTGGGAGGSGLGGTGSTGGTTGAGTTGGSAGSISSGSSSNEPTGSGAGGLTTGPNDGTGGSGGGPNGAQGFDLTRATDRGVDNCPGMKTCVKIGFLVAKIGGLDASGFALNLRGDIGSVINAYVAYQNKLGGLNGRPIVAIQRATDPVDQGDQQKACTEMTQDQKVFAVIDTASLIFAQSQSCFTIDNKAPLVHGYVESEGFVEAAGGYDVSEVRSLDRIAIEWADEIGKLGFLKGGEHVGILEDNCEPSHTVVQKLLIGGIKKYNPASVKTYESDCTAASAQAQPPGLQDQMCIDGVDHVLLATSFVAAQTFLQSADASPCGKGPKRYKYMASDYSLLASDLFTHNFSKTQFNGSLAITNQFTGIPAVSPQMKFCSKILSDTGLPGMDNSYPNADAAALCDYFFILVKNAQAVGPDLTRVAWAQAAQRLGTFDGAFSPQSIYRQNKTNGGELVHAMVWHQDCSCYRQTGPVHVGLG